MNAALRWLLDLLYPPKCMLCGRLLESAVQPLCGRCGEDLPEYEGAARRVPYFERCAAPFFYEPPIREAILRFKFRGMESYADQFAQWMAVSVRDKLEGTYDLISWVPCSRRRRRKRGFDQAELLAKALAKELNVEAACTLKKIRNNQAQSRTVGAAQRRANVMGVYRACAPECIAGRRILLVDDIITTGSTLSECGKTLRLAGSGDLVCAAIAVTRQDHEK